MPEVSVIVPVYNAGTFIAKFIGQLTHAFDKAGIVAEIILVDDKSTDDSIEKCREILATCGYPARLIELHRNTGQYFATLIGLDQAEGKVLITMDCDFSPPPSVLKHVWDRMPPLKNNTIYVEFKRRRTWLRQVGSWGFNSVVRWRTGKSLQQHSGSSFRIIDAPVYHQARAGLKQSALLDVALMKAAKEVSFIELPKTQAQDFSHHRLVRLLGYFVTLLSAEFKFLNRTEHTLDTKKAIKHVYRYSE